MNINDYTRWTDETAVYPEAGRNTERELNYLIMAFSGESGEVANEFKKRIRDKTVILEKFRSPKLTPLQKEKLVKELGDSLWYMVRIAKVLGYSMEQVAQLNHDKLMERKAADAIKDHS